MKIIVIRCYEFDRMLTFRQEALHYVPREPAKGGWVVLRAPECQSACKNDPLGGQIGVKNDPPFEASSVLRQGLGRREKTKGDVEYGNRIESASGGEATRQVGAGDRQAVPALSEYRAEVSTRPGHRAAVPPSAKKPKLGPFVERLEQLLKEDEPRLKKERRTALMLFEELQREGYAGAYDSVRRQVKEWRAERCPLTGVYIPLCFLAGDAFQFDWSEEDPDHRGKDHEGQHCPVPALL